MVIDYRKEEGKEVVCPACFEVFSLDTIGFEAYPDGEDRRVFLCPVCGHREEGF